MTHTDVITEVSPWDTFCVARDAYLDATDRLDCTSREYVALRSLAKGQRHRLAGGVVGGQPFATRFLERRMPTARDVNAARGRRDRARKAHAKAKAAYQVAWDIFRGAVAA